MAFSPRMWRCFLLSDCPPCLIEVFSTHVEMFPAQLFFPDQHAGFLHACGDVSCFPLRLYAAMQFSPRMWRCFFDLRVPHLVQLVFSTHVEMFLQYDHKYHTVERFLHACGDVSPLCSVKSVIMQFSPRMWRCFYCYGFL